MLRRFLAAALLISTIATPVAAQNPNASQAQELSSCAGAVAAVGDLDVVHYPNGASGEWSELLGRILERLNTERGVEGMTGRYAASAAKEFWLEQSRSRREAAANACRQRYGG